MLLPLLSAAPLALQGPVPAVDPTDPVEAALARAGDNRPALEAAIAAVPDDQRRGMRWLVARMPEQDLRTLGTDFLVENCVLAYTAWRTAPWHDEVSEELFLDAILPYANVSERRDRWRAEFRGRFAPLVADAESPGEAATILNERVFPLVGVRYSTDRARADQGPLESIEHGTASCTGLSILLIDACRAVGVPARFVGTPRWTDGSGNHSWVEVWDDGWHFTGAAEPTGRELDRAWFTGRASTAIEGHRRHGIYAVTWADSPLEFPMVWTRRGPRVRAVDVTHRYARPSAAAAVDAAGSASAVDRLARAIADGDSLEAIAGSDYAPSALTEDDAARAADMLRTHHRERIRVERAEENEARVLEHGEHRMPFWYKVTGEPGPNGRPLYISMHGGGGAPARVNDRQWENQKTLYEHPEGVYLAPRAPTNTWNLWHQAHVDALFDRLVENLVALENVDPDRVYLLGYSAGGDGVYQLAPRMADRFAAAAMMAGHPNETKPDGLRNLPFTLHMGADDAAYDRNAVAERWRDELARLREADPGGYEHLVAIHAGKGHWMDREDAVAIPWMAERTRDLRPDRVVWLQDDVTHERFYWLRVAEPVARQRLVVERDGQAIDVVEASHPARLTLLLDDGMDGLDLDAEVVVTRDGEELWRGRPRRTIGTMARTLAERGDPRGVFAAEVTVDVEP